MALLSVPEAVVDPGRACIFSGMSQIYCGFQHFLQLSLREQPDHPRIGCRADLKFGYYLDAFNDIQQRHACRRPVINVARAGDPANR